MMAPLVPEITLLLPDANRKRVMPPVAIRLQRVALPRRTSGDVYHQVALLLGNRETCWQAQVELHQRHLGIGVAEVYQHRLCLTGLNPHCS